MAMKSFDRRAFIKNAGISAAALPFLGNLDALAFSGKNIQKQRMVIFFSPNGVIPDSFWPNEDGENFLLKEILSPLEPFKKQTIVMNGVCDKVRGDGDNHMRGIGCLLTGIELLPGNVQGGSHTPAGWANGLSIDQEIKKHLQKSEATRTRFGSLELGVLVPDRADTWTRMSYSGANKPITPIDDPYQLFSKLYGQAKDKEVLGSVLDPVIADLKKITALVGKDDRKILEEHTGFVREMEKELRGLKVSQGHAMPKLDPGIREENDNLPKISRMQLDLLHNSLVADFNRIATFQFTNSVGGARMKWLGIEEGHHQLSHEPDTNKVAVEKLVKINKWFCEEIAYFAKKLKDTPEPNGQGSMLDNTLLVWTNELGKGNSHTLDNIPFVMVGGNLGWKAGRSLKFPRIAHNRLLMAMAHGFGHNISSFGNPEYCKDGPLVLS
ncbi:MAG: DUF1552 domain-containing protein [Planctomycetes bacterium]|nr:DUF1552 domain-containing protein [Planctomycetota bacterium]